MNIVRCGGGTYSASAEFRPMKMAHAPTRLLTALPPPTASIQRSDSTLQRKDYHPAVSYPNTRHSFTCRCSVAIARQSLAKIVGDARYGAASLSQAYHVRIVSRTEQPALYKRLSMTCKIDVQAFRAFRSALTIGVTPAQTQEFDVNI